MVTWGDRGDGGDSSSVSSDLSSGAVVIYSTGNAFAAWKDDGSVVTWGEADDSGGDSSRVQNELENGVQQIFSTEYAFAALKRRNIFLLFSKVISHFRIHVDNSLSNGRTAHLAACMQRAMHSRRSNCMADIHANSLHNCQTKRL